LCRDNGLNWIQENSPTTNNLFSVACPTVNNRYAFGQNGVFLRTLVNNWNLISTLGFDIYDIKMWNATTGYIVGTQNNEMVRTTANSGANWIMTLFENGRLNSIYCKAYNTIIAVGSNARVRISTNSGYSWTIPTLEGNSAFYSITFFGNDTGYIAGENGKIFKTINSGYNWTAQISGTNSLLRSITFVDNKTGWIVGDNGIVLKTLNGGITEVEENNKIPRNCKLFQNYPNPFNPKTKVRFELKDNMFLSIKVFDTKGCFLKEVVNGYFNTGEHGLVFDGTECASGIYFLKLETQNFTETKIMLLIK
jgi:hypothetical protein